MPAPATIAFITNSVTGHYQYSLWRELLPRARARGWNFITLIGRHSLRRKEPAFVAMNAIYDLASSRRVDGIIALSEVIFGPTDQRGMAEYFNRFGDKPIVLIATSLPGRPSIRVDGRQGIMDSVRHLAAAHGRRRIACLRGPEDATEAEERFLAYRAALESAGLPFDPSLVFPGDFTEEPGIRLASALAAREIRPFDALVAANDRMAIGFQAEALRLGVKVPQDVAITGFDDDEESVVTSRPLSTVRQPFPLMAERALDALEGILRGAGAPDTVTLPARFIARESCGCSGEIHGPDDATAPTGMTGLVRIREALMAEVLGDENKPVFSQAIASAIESENKDKRELYDVSAALASTRRRLDPGAMGREALHKAERLLLEGQLSVARRIERAYARELLSNEKSHLLMNELTTGLAEAISAEDIRSILGRILPEFEFRHATMTRAEWGPEDAADALPAVSTTDFVLRGGEDSVIPDAYQEPAFPTADILPDRAFPSGSPWAMSILPLVDRGQFLGLLFLESRKEDASIYAIFRSQVSGTIGRIALLAELLERETRERVETEKMTALGTLVAGIAHEVNTPVGVGVTAASHLQSSLSAYAAGRRAGTATEEDLAAFVADGEETASLILSNLQRAADLIVSFKRIAADSSSEERRSFLVRAYLSDILASLSPRLRRTRITVCLDCPEGLEIDGYPGAFSQVISNLIVNSLEHGYGVGVRGRIIILARAEGDRVKLVYEDDGKGISEEHVNRVFEPFFTTKREGGGTGLGLHIVYNAVTAVMGGRIAAGNRPGGGARFTMEIPMLGDGEKHGSGND